MAVKRIYVPVKRLCGRTFVSSSVGGREGRLRKLYLPLNLLLQSSKDKNLQEKSVV